MPFAWMSHTQWPIPQQPQKKQLSWAEASPLPPPFHLLLPPFPFNSPSPLPAVAPLSLLIVTTSLTPSSHPSFFGPHHPSGAAFPQACGCYGLLQHYSSCCFHRSVAAAPKSPSPRLIVNFFYFCFVFPSLHPLLLAGNSPPLCILSTFPLAAAASLITPPLPTMFRRAFQPLLSQRFQPFTLRSFSSLQLLRQDSVRHVNVIGKEQYLSIDWATGGSSSFHFRW